MALSERALCTAVDIQRELSLPEDAGSTAFDDYIEDASALIVDYLGRELHRDGAIVEKYAGDGTNILLLRRRPVWSITSVGYGPVGSAYDLASSSYEIDNPESGSVFFLGRLADDRTARAGVAADLILGSERRLYTVTYDGGWVTPGQSLAVGGPYSGQPVSVPRAMRRAAIEAVCFLRANPGGDSDIASESALSYSVSYRGTAVEAGSGGLPAGVTAKLERYVDVVMA